ncbi:hypothetical protein [Jiella sp. M17.18]|uniref:hypothetical protein n=1 Tax=Jiella sp. M17.18 TaxID=3234247 RepID=UPI0034DFFDB1
MDAIRTEILPDRLRAVLPPVGALKIKRDRHVLVIENGIVVTINNRGTERPGFKRSVPQFVPGRCRRTRRMREDWAATE